MFGADYPVGTDTAQVGVNQDIGDRVRIDRIEPGLGEFSDYQCSQFFFLYQYVLHNDLLGLS
jgi:hypothetical protein